MASGEDADGGGDCRRRRAHFGGSVGTRAGEWNDFNAPRVAFAQSCTLFFAPTRGTRVLVITHPCLSLTCVGVYVHKSRFPPSRVARVQGHHSGPWLGEEPSRGFSEHRGREGADLA